MKQLSEKNVFGLLIFKVYFFFFAVLCNNKVWLNCIIFDFLACSPNCVRGFCDQEAGVCPECIKGYYGPDCRESNDYYIQKSKLKFCFEHYTPFKMETVSGSKWSHLFWVLVDNRFLWIHIINLAIKFFFFILSVWENTFPIKDMTSPLEI